MKKLLALALAASLAFAAQAQARFGVIIPTQTTVADTRAPEVSVQLAFGNPFDGQGIDLDIDRAEVFLNGKAIDLDGNMRAGSFMGKRSYRANYKLSRPGIYTFAMTPKPYFAEEDDRYVVHYTKTIVAAFGATEGWNRPIGHPVEIIPLTRPFATLAPTVFRGQVLYKGRPLPNAIIRYEYLNGSAGTYRVPNYYYMTQVTRADANGIFVAGVPNGGWWGFAAPVLSEEKMSRGGEEKDVETAAVLWVQFQPVLKNR